MNVQSEIKALRIVTESLPQKFASGEYEVEVFPKIYAYLYGRLRLIEGQIRADKLVEFQRSVEATIEALP